MEKAFLQALVILEEEEGFLRWNAAACVSVFVPCRSSNLLQSPCFSNPCVLKDRPLELNFLKSVFLLSALQSYSCNPLRPLKRSLKPRNAGG